MTTYANIKLSEIFALYGNPFTRGFCKKNFYEKIIKKHFKKVQFREEITKKIKLDSNYDEGNSKIKRQKMFNKGMNSATNNNKHFYYLDNKEKVSPYNKSIDLNINQKGDINNYNDIKKFEELQ